MKCLEKDRGRRYDSAGALSQDIARHVNHEPVSAAPPSRLYRFRRFVRRQRRSLAVAAGVLAVIAAITVYSVLRIAREHDAAVMNAKLAQEQRALVEDRLGQSILSAGRSQLAAGEYIDSRASYYEAWDLLARRGGERATLPAAIGLLNVARASPLPLMGPDNSPGGGAGGFATGDPHYGIPFFRKDEREAMVMCDRDSFVTFDTRTGRVLRRFRIPPDLLPYEVGGYVDESSIRFVRPSKGMVTVNMVTGDRELIDAPELGKLKSFVTSDDKQLLVGVDESATIHVWDTTTWKRLRTLPPNGGQTWVGRLTFLPGNRAVLTRATVKATQKLQIRDLTTGGTIQDFADIPASNLTQIGVLPDGKRVITACNDGIVRIHDVASGKVVHSFKGHVADVRDFTWTPDLKYLATTGGDGTVRLWDFQSAQQLAVLAATTDSAHTVTCSEDGRTLIAGGGTGRVQLWDLPSAIDPKSRKEVPIFAGHEGGILGIASPPMHGSCSREASTSPSDSGTLPRASRSA